MKQTLITFGLILTGTLLLSGAVVLAAWWML